MKSDDDLPGKIKNIVKEQATKQQRATNGKNQEIISNLKGWAQSYLNAIGEEFAKAENRGQQEDIIKAHQDKLLGVRSDNSSIPVQESVDYYRKAVKDNLSNVDWANNFAKTIYKLTMEFQSQVNDVLGQITKNVFIITGPDNEQYFFTANANDIFFEGVGAQNQLPRLQLDEAGIKYNISYADVEQFLMQPSDTLKSLLSSVALNKTGSNGRIFNTFSAGKSGQRLFARRFALMMAKSQEIMNKRRVSNESTSSGNFSVDFFNRLQQNSSFRFLFYSSHNNRRKQSKIALSESHLVELKKLREKDIISFKDVDIKAKDGKNLIDLNNISLIQKSKSIFDIIGEGQIGEIYANEAVRPFDFQGQHFELAYQGAKGWAKEAFFGAYFGLQLGQHQIRLKEGMTANINKEQFNLLSYLAGTDSARARLTGDYNISLGDQKYAIQIKGEGSGVKVQQFIELARYILKYNFKDAETFLKVIKAFDESKGIVSMPRFTPYQQQQGTKGHAIEPFRKIVKNGLTKKPNNNLTF